MLWFWLWLCSVLLCFASIVLCKSSNCVCACVCVRAYVRAYVRACVVASVCVCVVYDCGATGCIVPCKSSTPEYINAAQAF